MNIIKTPQLMLTNGAIFPFYLNASLLGKGQYILDELKKQRIIAIIKNSHEAYLSDIADALEMPIKETIDLISELKKEGKIKAQ
jgi:hypothetical protein